MTNWVLCQVFKSLFYSGQLDWFKMGTILSQCQRKFLGNAHHLCCLCSFDLFCFVWFVLFGKGLYFRSQTLEHTSSGNYRNIFGVPLLPVIMIVRPMFFKKCWYFPEAHITGMPKLFSIVQFYMFQYLGLKIHFLWLYFVKSLLKA